MILVMYVMIQTRRLSSIRFRIDDQHHAPDVYVVDSVYDLDMNMAQYKYIMDYYLFKHDLSQYAIM